MATSASQETLASAGQFAIEATIGAFGGCEFFRGKDPGGKAVELTSAPVTGQGTETLRQWVASVAGHGIDNLSDPIGVEASNGKTFVVSNAIPGGTLRALLERKKSTGASGFAPRAAGSLIGRLCTIVGALHKRGLVHGNINLETIRVDKAGGVHLAGLGLAPIIPGLAAAAPGPTLAPELASGSPASASTDLFAIGAVLYEVLVGSPPTRGCARPSEVVDELGVEVDQVIAAAMHPSIDRRPPNAEALKKVLKAALGGQAATKASDAPRVARPSLAEAIAAPSSGASRASGQIAAALAADDEAWLISKDGLDYGPFSMAKVFEMIRTDEILPGHMITNKHTGERAPVEEHPLLSELVDEAKLARDERRRADAEVSHSKTEKRRGAILYGFIAAAVIGLGLGAYFLIGKLSADKEEKAAKLGSLEEGELQATISFPTRDKASSGKSSGKGKRGKRSNSGGGNTEGWDDAVDFGDASKGGGDERLSDGQINPVVQSAGGRLGSCLSKNGGGRAAIKFVIKGSGKVSYVAVNGKTDTGLAKCIGRVMRGLSFPSFDGARTRANFTMSF